jgi:hypothetical protein
VQSISLAALVVEGHGLAVFLPGFRSSSIRDRLDLREGRQPLDQFRWDLAERGRGKHSWLHPVLATLDIRAETTCKGAIHVEVIAAKASIRSC